MTTANWLFGIITLGMLSGLGIIVWQYGFNPRLKALQQYQADSEQQHEHQRKTIEEQQKHIVELEKALAVRESELKFHQEKDKTQGVRYDKLENDLQTSQHTYAQLKVQLAQIENQLHNERKQNAEKISLLENVRKELGEQFKNVANDIMKENTLQFKQQSSEQLVQLLSPLRVDIGQFKQKTEEIQLHNVQQNTQLIEQLKAMQSQVGNITQEAHQLSTALRGEAKQQGNWGEMILDMVLERSGLREGEHYERQKTIRIEGEGVLIPDVVVKLPHNKHLIIDSKVSLNAYSRYVNSETEANPFLQEHVNAIRTHIKTLSSKNYALLPGINAPELVVMFMPIESAFAAAMRFDPELASEAISHKILLTTPSTLLASVHIIAQLWHHENQNRNTADLNQAVVKIYEKLRLFVENIDKLGKALENAQKIYGQTKGQLISGKGNLIKQAEIMINLGSSRPTKRLSVDLVERADLELESLPATVQEEYASDGSADSDPTNPEDSHV